MGGRGSSSGESLGGGGNENINIASETDIWSYRHNPANEPFVDSMNNVARDIQGEFPDLMSETVTRINASELRGADRVRTLGYYTPAEKSVSLNRNYTNVEKMNQTYDASVASGFHPSRGNKNGVEAVTAHELGHALTDHVGKKMGETDIDSAAKRIVDNAYANNRGRGGTKKWAGGISGYAQHSNAECVAEAVADWYCNGSKASRVSKAIMSEMFKYR